MTETLDPAKQEVAPMQDLHIATIRGPDKDWARPDVPKPSEARLKAPSSHVIVVNEDLQQTHIVVDRYCVGHEIHAGHRERMEMLDEDIEYFLTRRGIRDVPRIVDGVIVNVPVKMPINILDDSGAPYLFGKKIEEKAHREYEEAHENADKHPEERVRPKLARKQSRLP